MQDIEQLVVLGKELGACPYYGVRHAIPSAQVCVYVANMSIFDPIQCVTPYNYVCCMALVDSSEKSTVLVEPP